MEELKDSLAEEALLGALLINPGAIVDVVDKVKPEDFSLVRNQWILKALLSMWQQNIAVDFVTLTTRLKEDGVLEQVGTKYLARLSNAVPSALHAAHYADIVHGLSIRRQVITACGSVASKAYDRKIDTVEVMANVEKQLLSIDADNGSEPRRVSELAEETKEAILARTPDDFTGKVTTGVEGLDELVGGFPKGEMVVVAGRPSMGKTCYAMQQALKAAMDGHNVTVFSLEMSTERLMERLFATYARLKYNNSSITGNAIARGTLTDGEREALKEVSNDLAQLPLVIDDHPSQTPISLLSKCRRIKAQHGLDLVIIDYMQLMGTGKKIDSRVSEFTEISNQMKQLARTMEIPVVVISQLSRKVEQRQNKRPLLSDLRESGAIEQDADLVIFLYRDSYYNKDTSDYPNVAEVIVGKNRNGPTGTVHTYFDAGTHSLLPLAPGWRRL